MGKILYPEPILSGTISTAFSKCGKLECVCKARPPKLHGPYYRWTGLIEGRQTTKTLSKEVAEECERRIANFRSLQNEIKKSLNKGFQTAPWIKNAGKLDI